LRTAIAATPRKLVVLDDDPTGTQTVHDIAVVTRWDVATLRAELERHEAGFYILTNSRSLSAPAAYALNIELAQNLRAAAAEAGVDYTIVSRSDSTLRGHFQIETDALGAACGPFHATLLVPYFEAGGRYTMGDTHYVMEGDALVPAAETPFARDVAFGYRNSDLRAWVEEKTAGRVRAADVQSLSLQLIRGGGPDAVLESLLSVPHGACVIVNAVAPRDVEVVALATLRAEQRGRSLLFRTAASFVAARLGLEPRPLLDPAALATGTANTGGLIIAGSHVPKTTQQLARLREVHAVYAVELPVDAVLGGKQASIVLDEIIRRTNTALLAGKDVLVFTSRHLVAGSNAEGDLEIGQRVSQALISVVQGLHVRPRFLVAKGGITSSDIATRGLNVQRALVLGQLLPGVPVWRLGPEAKFPGLNYVVFPGNVGGPDALADAYRILRVS
jgi:uncharacterized protein YgbK (DUF1537 family)